MKRIIPLLILIAGGIAVFAWFITTTTQQADMLIINAKVYTVDAQNSIAEAIAIQGDKIAAVGTTEDLRKRYTSENILDAEGKTVVPGFIDSHGHVSGLGSSLTELNLVGTTSVQQIAEMVAKKASIVNVRTMDTGPRMGSEHLAGQNKREDRFPMRQCWTKVLRIIRSFFSASMAMRYG